jgi:HAD superfamily hydrolase (TIGR01509 family)
MIKAILLDLGGVYFTDGKKIASRKIAEKFHLDTNRVAEVLAGDSDIGKKYRRGEITFEEFWEEAKKRLLIDASSEELNKIWFESYEPIAETIEIVGRVKKKGIKLYYLSDSVKERVDYMDEKYKFRDNFMGGILSHEVNLTKKDGPRLFRLAVEETRERSEDVVFVDDVWDNVETAIGLGMKGIHFKNPKQLEKDLKKLGLKF